MAVALGNASRPSFDAAGAMLENKRIETQKAIARMQASAQKRAQAMQLGQNLLRMANDNAQQQAQIQAQQQRDAMMMAERQRQEAMAQQSSVERQANEMETKWRAGLEEARKNGFDFDPRHEQQIFQLKETLRNIETQRANGTLNAREAAMAKIAIVQRLAQFKPDVRVQTPQQQAMDKMLRVGPDGTPLPPGTPFVPGERTYVLDEKNNPKAVPPLPQPKQADPAEVRQKIAEQMMKKEETLLKEKRSLKEKILSQKDDEHKPRFTDEQAESMARKMMQEETELFQRQFGVIPPGLAVQSTSRPTYSPQQRAADEQLVQSWSELTDVAKSVNPSLQRSASQAAARLQQNSQQPEGAPQRQAAPAGLEANLNGKPISDFARYVLGRGANVGPDEFFTPDNPIAQRYIANALGNKDEAFKTFDADRTQIIKSVPMSPDGNPPEGIQPGSLFINKTGELQQFTGATPAPRPPSGGGGAPQQRSSLPPANRAIPGDGGAPQPPAQGGRAAPPQQPQMPRIIDQVLDPSAPVGAQAKAPDGRETRTLLFLYKGDPASEAFVKDVLSKMSPQEQDEIYVETLDKNDPNSRWDLADKYKIGGKAEMVREEWNGKGYEVTGKTSNLATHGDVAGFMQPIGVAPPNGMPREKTEVFFEKGSASEKKWQQEILPRLSADELRGIKVFAVDAKPRGPDTKVDAGELRRLDVLQVARNHNFDPKQGMLLINGKYDHQTGRYLENNSATSETVKNWKDFKEFVRPSHEKNAEFTKQLVAERDKQAEIAKAEQEKADASERQMWNENFDENVSRSGKPIVAGMPIPQEGEKGYENFQRALKEWQQNNARTPTLATDIVPAGMNSISPQSLTDEFQRSQFNQRGKLDTQSAPFKMTSDREELLRAYDESKAYGEALNRESQKIPLNGKTVTDVAKQAADNLRKQGIYPPTVSPRVKMLLDRQSQPAPAMPSRVKLLEQQLQKLKSESKEEKSDELKDELEKNRREAEGLQSPMSAPVVPSSSTSPQSMRTSDLMQPFTQGVRGASGDMQSLLRGLQGSLQDYNAIRRAAGVDGQSILNDGYSSTLQALGGPQSQPQQAGFGFGSSGSLNRDPWTAAVTNVPQYAGGFGYDSGMYGLGGFTPSYSPPASNLNLNFGRAEWNMNTGGNYSIDPSYNTPYLGGYTDPIGYGSGIYSPSSYDIMPSSYYNMEYSPGYYAPSADFNLFDW